MAARTRARGRPGGLLRHGGPGGRAGARAMADQPGHGQPGRRARSLPAGHGPAVGQQESHRKPSPPSGGLGNLLDAAQMLEKQYGQLQTHPAFGAVFTQLQQEAISLQRYLLTQMGR